MAIENNKQVKEHFELIAKDYDDWKKKNWYYYSNIKSFIKNNLLESKKVLEVGCATGEILNIANPSLGVGIDISPQMIEIAEKKFPQYKFKNSSIEDFDHPEKFDYILMIDLIDHVYDIVGILENLHRFCHPNTKLIITTINPWWEPMLSFMEKIGAKMPEGPHNFVEKRNLSKLIEFLDYSIIKSEYLLLFPKYIPLLSFLANTIGTKIWGLNKFSFVHTLVLHPLPKNNNDLGYGCSVIIPCHDEEGNITEAVRRIPAMGKKTEIIVVDDGSKDKTSEVVLKLKTECPGLKLITYKENKGKGFAVKQGFDAATQGIIMILDADMSVPPEELARFFELLNKGVCDFVNGTRLVYPVQKQAMRFLNLLGNKVFGLLMTCIIGQHLTDTLCGTKALYKENFKHIKMGRDKWGDFDLLFGTAKLGNKIMEMPVHYKARIAGESKMKTLQHGVHLLKACFRGVIELVLFKNS